MEAVRIDGKIFVYPRVLSKQLGYREPNTISIYVNRKKQRCTDFEEDYRFYTVSELKQLGFHTNPYGKDLNAVPLVNGEEEIFAIISIDLVKILLRGGMKKYKDRLRNIIRRLRKSF